MTDTAEPKVTPIAIVGCGGRFPGDASTPDRLWEILMDAKSTLSETPKDRFNADAFYHPQPSRPGSQNFKAAHFMNRAIDAFDAPFFSITPSEAKAMDPQQRMCLEVAYEAMENAGITLGQASGSQTSCYVGCFNHDYQNMMNKDPETLPFYNATGTEASCLSNRVSWFFNLTGPSMTVDTACSSSLVALHLACQSIRSGESEMALAGGVNIISSTEMNMQLSNLQMISPEGKSKTFDAKADGYGRGEGTCFVVVKSLDKAIQDNDVIRAVICNTGSNQDGNTPGLTLPSRSMQEALIRKVYDEAGLKMEETGYFEAHGTGTVAGDSTETRALGETIGKLRPPGQPLWVGSIKANIGHLEGGSGLAALIKTIYVLEKGIIPPQIWYQNINPRIRLKEWNLAVPTKVTHWPYPGPRRASVNSFGFAGANAHVILEDAGSYLRRSGKPGRHISRAAEESTHSPTRSQVSEDSGFSSVDEETSYVKAFPRLIVWSAHEQGGLNRISESWKEYLSAKTSMCSQSEQYKLLRDLAHTAAKKRTQFPWRSFTVSSSPEAITTGQADIASPVRTSQKPKLAFVFTGQGAQHYAMGRRLMAYEVYAESLRGADKYLESLGCPWSLIEELSRDAESSRVNPAEFSQPLCIALQVALVDLLRSLGVWPPELVIGHSGGETAAAYAKGALTRESAWKVAYHRGRVCSMLPEINPELELNGDMLAAGISEETAKEYIKEVEAGELVVACVNSPTSVTLSGDVPAIIEAEKLIKGDGHLAKRLGVNRAYHSGHMKVVADMYTDLLKDVHGLPETPESPKMYSCVTGELINNSDLGGEYWVTNLLNQVKFSQAMTGLITHSNNRRAKPKKGYCSVNVMLEIGPHGALQGPVKQNLKAAGAECTSISVLDRKKDAAQSLLEAMGILFQHGYESDIEAANFPNSNDTPKPLVDLPPYPWNHSNRYWHESAVASSYRFKKFPRKDLLGLRDNEDNDEQPRWRHFLRLSENPWMEDHQVQGKVIYPAAGMLAMALEASREVAEADRAVEAFELRDVSIKAAIIIPSGEEGVETMLHMHPWKVGGHDAGSSAWKEFSIYSRQSRNPWMQNCTGLVRIQYKSDASTESFVDETKQASAVYRSEYQSARQNCRQSIRTDAFYSEQSKFGLEFGETFQNVEDIHTTNREMVCAVRTPNVRNHMPHGFTHDHLIHPCTLDPIVHSCLAILNGGDFEKGASVPISIGHMMVSADVSSEPGTVFSVHSTAEPYGLRDGEVTIKASTTEWESAQIMFDRLRISRLGGGGNSTDDSDEMRKIASKIHWDIDVSHLKAAKRALPSFSIETGENIASLEYFVRLLGHKHPDLKLLEVGATNGELTKKLLNALKGRDGESTPWSQLYTAATERAEDVKTLEKAFSAWGSYFKAMQLEPSQSWEEQALQSQSYDCILIRAEVGSGRTDALLENVRPFLKDQGSLVILPPTLSADSQNVWNEQLKKYNFTGVDYAVAETEGDDSIQTPAFLVSTPDTGNSCIPDEILVVGPSHPGALFDSLKQQLQPHGVEPVHTTLCKTQNMDLSNKHCIITSDLERPILFDISAKNFLLLKRLLLESRSVLWVTAGATMECSEPKASLATGLIRSINQEHPELSLTTLDVDAKQNDVERNAEMIVHVLQRASEGDIDHEFSVRDGRLKIPRILLDRELNHYSSVLRDGPRPEPGPLQQPGRNLAMSLGVPGKFDSVYFRDDPSTQSPLTADDVEIEVRATGLSSLDLHSALDHARGPAFGYECSGVIRNAGSNVSDYKPGDRVMTWCTGAFANVVRSPASLVQPMSIGMSFEAAAALPINYCTAYQALVECARLSDGERVLIHSAAGGVGQAAIMIAQNLGAEVYVTVGTEEKRSQLIETYGLQEDHIFSSRGVQFSRGILRVTQSTGVDVVMNCLSGESVRHSWECLAPFGRFIEIGQTNSGYTDLSALATRNVSFHAVDINGLRKANPTRAARLFKQAIGFCREKACQPASPLQVKGFSEIANGLRLLRSGKQMGKVVFKARDSETVMAIPPPIKSAELRPDAAYIIVGGFGGLGQHIAKWMAENGARHLIFLSRSGGSQPEAKRVIADIEAQGANVTAYQCDISNLDQVQGVMKEITGEGRPPVRGVVQAAMSLADATFRQMTPKQWELSTNTKALGTWNIHCTAPRELDFFIMLSSVSGIIGLRGQANYAAGNTFLDALARHRRAQGMAAMAIDVGAVFDVGYMAEKDDMKEMMRNLGFIGLSGTELVGILQTGLDNADAQHPDKAQVILGLASGGYLAAEGIDMPYYFSDSKMGHLKRIGATGEGGDGSGPGLSEQLNKAASRTAAAEAVSDALRARLAKQMMVNVEDVDASKPVSGYGVDSLTAVDIRAWSLKEAQADISILDIVNNSSIMALAENIVGNSKIMANRKLED